MICAICLMLGRKLLPLDETEALAGSALTVANGTALCREHLDLLRDWKNEVHGPLSLDAQVEIVRRAAGNPGPA